jgi:proteic killer suppression protein
MLKTFKSKGLAELWSIGRTAKINAKMARRVLLRLGRLDLVKDLSQANVPGFDFHPLRGFEPTRYSIHVNGPWCITFEFDGTDVYKIDFEQYH